MTEPNNAPSPLSLVHDKDVALDMAYAAKPHWEAANLAMQAAFDSHEAPADASGTVKSEKPEEKTITPERLSEIVHESAFSVSTAMEGTEIPNSLLGDSTIKNGFMVMANNESLRRIANNSVYNVASQEFAEQLGSRENGEQAAAALLESFVGAGISELITISEIKSPFRRVRPDSPKGDEPIVAISYQPIYLSGKFDNRKYRAASHDGRPGNQLLVNICLPKSSADELLAAIESDPKVIRNTVDTLMHEEVHAMDSWDGPRGVRPLYEEWSEVNGGVNRIAVRTHVTQGPQDSKILEF